MTKFNDRDRALRSKLRVEQASLVKKLKELESPDSGEKVSRTDIDACKGEIEVIRKELQSIEDGGHTVFMRAKKMLKPKAELSQKEKKINWKKKQIDFRIKSIREDLNAESISAEERIQKESELEKFENEKSELDLELNAVNDYNHTRFVVAHGEHGEGIEQSKQLKEVNEKIEKVQKQIIEAKEKNNSELINELNEQYHFLELEKESIENFSHDEFLKNLEMMKARRKSQLG